MASAVEALIVEERAKNCDALASEGQIKMKYESNPKHREPWQRGKRGGLCPKNVWHLADQLLALSVDHGS